MQQKKGDAMTFNYGETVWWNTLVSSLLSLAASAVAFSSAVTDIAVNQQNTIKQHHTVHQCYFISQLIRRVSQFLSVFIIPSLQITSLCKVLSIFKVEEHLPDQEYLHHWQLLSYLGSWKCCWGPYTKVHNPEWGVADPGSMGKCMGTDNVVSLHECISACQELVLPSKPHHSVQLLGSVLLCLLLPHLLLLCLHWWGGEPLGVLNVSGVLF